MDIPLADVMIHIDEPLSAVRRGEVDALLRAIDGVISVHNPEDRPHLTIVGYRPDMTDAQTLLAGVRSEGIRAELVGL